LNSFSKGRFHALLKASGQLGFAKILSAGDFRVSKPNPAVCLGAAEKLGVQPAEAAMVAAHLML
jgi:2-haloacid dehalogenase